MTPEEQQLLDRIRASLWAWPNQGVDSEIAAAVDNIMANVAARALEAAIRFIEGEGTAESPKSINLATLQLVAAQTPTAAEAQVRKWKRKAATLDALVDFMVADPNNDNAMHEKAGELLSPYLQARAAREEASDGK